MCDIFAEYFALLSMKFKSIPSIPLLESQPNEIMWVLLRLGLFHHRGGAILGGRDGWCLVMEIMSIRSCPNTASQRKMKVEKRSLNEK